MCNYSDFVEQQGLKKGREEGHLESLSESVANLVRSGHFSIEAALDILKVSARYVLNHHLEASGNPHLR